MLDVFVRYVLCPSHDRHEAVGRAAAELGCFFRVCCLPLRGQVRNIPNAALAAYNGLRRRMTLSKPIIGRKLWTKKNITA